MRPCITIAVFFLFISYHLVNGGVQLLSKSKLEKCEKVSENAPLNCTKKIVINLAVPSEASGNEASIVAEVVEVEEKSTDNMRTVREPPVITVNKSAAYAQYHLTYIRDVPYKPLELSFKTRKCSRYAGANVVGMCETLVDEQGHVIENTRPICCPCGGHRRVPSSCGNFFDKLTKGKANTAHCLRFPGDWFHVFGIGQHSIGFTIRVKVKTGSKVSELVISPGNRTALSSDNFLRVNLIGDYVGYNDVPSFENFFLVVPRQGSPGQPQDLGRNISMWMLLERVRFTLDGNECNKIGVGYDAFNNQPNFCSAPFWACLQNQLWNFWEADQNRIQRNLVPLYGVQGRFERINQHPNAGSQSFSIGITEVLNSNLLIELSADDIEFVYQRSPGKIERITIPNFEALTQFGTATITARNIGEVEASYSLTFDCSIGISQMEEQFFILKPKEMATRSFKVYPMSDQAARYACSAILKDSDFQEADRAECQFTTTATILDNGSVIPWEPPKHGLQGFFESVEDMFFKLWHSMIEFITGKACSAKCSGLFDFQCHIHYLCMKWVLMFGSVFAIFPTVIVLLWLLHENGVFDPVYDWWEDHFWDDDQKAQHIRNLQLHYKKHHKKEKDPKHHKAHAHKKGKIKYPEHQHQHQHQHQHSHNRFDHDHLHHVKKEKHRHGDEVLKEHHKDKHVSRHDKDKDKHHKHKRRNSIP
ncbi:hypothetical protein Lser_V15G09825 [Lactuca serriola]